MLVEYIVIHHSATKDSGTVSWQAIRRYHVLTNGWLDIGYHFGLELIDDGGGLARTEILIGRMPGTVGAHTKEAGMNRRSLGILCTGNFDEDLLPRDMIERLGNLVQWLQRVYNIPKRNVIGHREVGLMVGLDWRNGQYKSCPGSNFDLDRFREGLL